MKIARSQPQTEGVNLTPLIDVVFLLLIFFMVSTTFTKETRLELDLPKAEQGSAGQQSPFELVLSADGKVRIGDHRYDLAERVKIMSALGELKSSHPNTPLVLVADANASHQSVISVMDMAGKVGVSQLSLATVPIDGD